jgi:hypothetical protein
MVSYAGLMNNPQESSPDEAFAATVPLPLLKKFDNESLRWPPDLDREAIVQRLVSIRENAPDYRNGLDGLARLLAGVESMSPAQIGGRVLSALTWTEENPGHAFLAEQLQIVAVNLKNLH